MDFSRDAAAPLDPEQPEGRPRELHHRAAAHHSALTQLLQHPGWAIYSRALAARRDACLLEMRACMRRGDTMIALVKSMMADVLDDCLDVAKIEIDQAAWTMHQTDDLARALREERDYSRRQGGR